VEESDFLSLGTNDLVQYTVGIDRGDAKGGDLSYCIHPSIMRMMKKLSVEAKRQNKSVCLCGEIASNPLFIPFLLGLGIDLSCSLRYVPIVKQTIRKIHLAEAIELAEKISTLSSSKEILQALKEFSL
jgi:phosphoenolpyruvate-protein phosphotransferase (PTS system enzyme I)